MARAREREEAARQRQTDDRARVAAARAARAAMAPPTPLIRENPNVTKQAEFDLVKVYFATDRAAGDEPGAYGAERAATVSYGSIDVSVPRSHKPGEIERPAAWEVKEDPRRHMVVIGREVTDEEQFFANLRDTLQRGGSKASFVFVPGFNVTFDDAARRTAQITYDLDFRGAPVFYSWPSAGEEGGYARDEAEAERSEPHLRAFLRAHAERSGAEDIYLIAHSLGARTLATALANLFTEQPLLRVKFKNIILSAPDIDAEAFKTEIAPKLAGGLSKVTLYVSSVDKALRAAHAAGATRRLGDADRRVAVLRGIETVDASAFDTSFVEEAYAEKVSVLSDIRRVIVDGLDATERGLQRYEESGQNFWRLEPPPQRSLRWDHVGERLQLAA